MQIFWKFSYNLLHLYGNLASELALKQFVNELISQSTKKQSQF